MTIIGRQLPGATSTFRSWLHLFGTASDTSRMQHTRITDVRLDGGASRREAPLLLEDVTAEHSHTAVIRGNGRGRGPQLPPLECRFMSAAS